MGSCLNRTSCLQEHGKLPYVEPDPRPTECSFAYTDWQQRVSRVSGRETPQAGIEPGSFCMQTDSLPLSRTACIAQGLHLATENGGRGLRECLLSKSSPAFSLPLPPSQIKSGAGCFLRKHLLDTRSQPPIPLPPLLISSLFIFISDQ